MVGKKLLSLLTCLSFFFASNYSSSLSAQVNALPSSFNINQRKSDQAKLKAKQNSLEKALKETQKKVGDKRQQYDLVNNQILATQNKKNKLNCNINTLKSKILKIKQDIDAKEIAVKENTEVLKQRLVAVYKAGEVHLIDLIFNAKTFEEFIDKAEIITKVSEHDNRLLNALKDDIKSLENMKKSLDDEEVELESERISLTTTEAQLQELLAENESILKQLEGEQAIVQAEIDESDAEYQRIQNEINAYLSQEAERKRKEEEARKKAAAEALKEGKKASNIEKLSVTTSSKSSGNWIWPVPSCRTLSSQYNEKRGSTYHKGIDIAGPKVYGANVVAVDDGVVITSFSGCTHDYGKLRSCGCGGGYGNYVIISHGNGKVSIYGHLSAVSAAKGQKVKKGEKIGEVGTTGYSTGPHLHFQTKNNGVDYNPLNEY